NRSPLQGASQKRQQQEPSLLGRKRPIPVRQAPHRRNDGTRVRFGKKRKARGHFSGGSRLLLAYRRRSVGACSPRQDDFLSAVPRSSFLWLFKRMQERPINIVGERETRHRAWTHSFAWLGRRQENYWPDA